jgi:hypothetical protein
MNKKWIIAGVLMATLTACGSVKDQLGLDKKAPDEFAVVTRAPLSVPPNYELRPPAPGTQRPQEASAQDQAKNTVFETSVNQPSTSTISKSSLQSPLEQKLLQQAGAASTDASIRQQVDREAGQLLDTEQTTVNKILFWHDDAKPTETLVNAPEEKKRLEKNAEEGKPVTEGETPQIKPKSKSTLDKILK